MKKKRTCRKLAAVMLGIAMLAGTAGCGDTADVSTETAVGTEEAAEASASESNTSAAEGETITLTIMGETGNDGISTDDAVGRYIQEKLGIVLEYQQVSSDKIQVLAASGDLPDIVEMHNSGTMISTLIDSGSLWCMDEWLESNGENLKAKIPTALKYSKEIMGNGSTYFIPTVVQKRNEEVPNYNGYVGFFTRWDLYKELGYPQMNGEDDYLNVLKQMQELNPETEDGRKIYALSGFTDWGLWPYSISYPFSNGYNNGSYNQMVNSFTGEIQDMFLDEDGVFWDSIAFYNKAYRMGIMDPEAFTMKYDQYNNKVLNGEVLTCIYNWTQPDTSVCGELAGMYLLPGAFPYADSLYPMEDELGFMTSSALVISNNCEYPEKAMELIDFLNSDEGLRLIFSGIQGVDWDYVDGVPQLIGTRKENVESGNTVSVDYASTTGTQGLYKYKWLSSASTTDLLEDGYPVDLSEDRTYKVAKVDAAAADFCEYYAPGEAEYPGDVYVKWVEDGTLTTADSRPISSKLVGTLSTDNQQILTRADEYFQANVASIITAADDDAFETQKQKMISDIKAMGYEEALAEVQQLYADAAALAETFAD